MKNKKGFALPFALVIMFAVAIILSGAIQFVVSQTKYGSYIAAKEESLQIAEAGMNFYQWYLAHNLTGKSAAQVQEFWNNNPIAVGTPACGTAGAYEMEYKDPSGGAVGKYCLEVTKPPAWSTVVVVKAVGWTYRYPQNKRTIQVRLRRAAWSEYMILADGMFRLSSETVINGKMHSNEGIHFDGVAYNVTTSSANTTYCDIDYYNSSTGRYDCVVAERCVNNLAQKGCRKPGVWTVWANDYNSTLNSPVFRAGKSFPVSPYTFSNISADFGLVRNVAWGSNHVATDRLDVCPNLTNSGCYFNNASKGRHIILNSGGTFNICTVNDYSTTTNVISSYLKNSGSGTCASCSGDCARTFNIPNDGVIYVEENLWLEGAVSGKKISIVAADLDDSTVEKNVFFKNSLRYTNYDGQDVIGVSAEKDIEFIQNSADTLRIDGALVAKEGRVGRKYYDGRALSSITINGSIATKGRINFGYADNTGYRNRNLIYDNNLLYSPPPYFPSGSEYLMDLWEEL